MFKKMLVTVFGLALAAVSALTPAHAGLVIKQDFWGKNADNSLVLFGQLIVDPTDAVQWNNNIYKAYGWKSFKLFGTDVATPAPLFEAEFDMDNLYGGFTFLTFDVSDIGNQYNFFGFHDGFLDVAFYDLTDASKDYSDPSSVIFTGDDVIAPASQAVSAPASAALLLAGFAGLMLRRRQAA